MSTVDIVETAGCADCRPEPRDTAAIRKRLSEGKCPDCREEVYLMFQGHCSLCEMCGWSACHR
jgi:hypothetical protein